MDHLRLIVINVLCLVIQSCSLASPEAASPSIPLTRYYGSSQHVFQQRQTHKFVVSFEDLFISRLQKKKGTSYYCRNKKLQVARCLTTSRKTTARPFHFSGNKWKRSLLVAEIGRQREVATVRLEWTRSGLTEGDVPM